MSTVNHDDLAVREARDAAIAQLADRVRQLVNDRDDLLNLIVRLRTGRLDEQVRRHYEGLKLKSTYNSDRVKTLAAIVAKLTAELKPLVTQTLLKISELEFARLELDAYRRAEEEIAAERAIRAEAGMYAEPARLIDLLYKEYGIDRSYFASLKPEDVNAIARILHHRAGPLRARDALDRAVREAGAF